MLPGKKYTVDDVVRILRRRIWYVLLPMAVAAAAMSMFVRGLPDRYVSKATILVVPQRISEQIIQPTISATVVDRLPAIREAMLSRTRLEQLIEEFDLYPNERRTMVMEDVVERMRRDILMATVGARTDAFEIGFYGPDPDLVMRVATRLGDIAIQQSLSYRHNLAQDTDAFLESQLEETRRQLELQEQRLAAYQRTYAGELPSQVNSNLQQVTVAAGRLQAALDTIDRAMERRTTLETTLADLQRNAVVAPAPPVPGAPVTAGTTLQQLGAAQDELSSLEARGLKPGHPDLESARRRVRDLTQRLDAENRQSAEATAAAPRPMSAGEAQRLARIKDVQEQLAEIDRQIARAREDERQARAAAEGAQQRLDSLPTREAEMVALTRDYSITEGSYRSLLAKRDAARIAANLEQRQVGEQFNVVDPARVPQRPVSPDRARLNLTGIALGLAFGLGLVGLLEYRDRTFKTDEDLSMVLGLPVLAVVPLMESAADRRLGIWKRLGVGAACLAVLAGCLAIFVYAVAG